MLPDEVWEEILKDFEIFELIRLKTVSIEWHDMVDRLINRECKWYKKCLKDIPQEYWSSLLEHQTDLDLPSDDFHESKMLSHVWSSMYKSWRGWNNLTKKTPRVRTIDMFPDQPDPNHRGDPVALSASGNIIAIGIHAFRLRGHFIVYDISKSGEEPIFKRHEQRIEGVQACRKGNDVTVVVSTADKVQFWNTSTKRLIHEYKDLPDSILMSASLGYFYVLVHNWEQIQNPAADELTWNMEKLSCGINLRIVHRRKRFEDETVHAMVADGDKIQLLLGTSYYTSMKVHEISPGSKKMKQLSENCIDLLDDGFYVINMCKPCVLLSVDSEEDCLIRASVAGRQWNLCGFICFRRDDCNWDGVTAFHYHAGLLILGSRSGEICIMRVENMMNDLEKFDFEQMEYTMVKLGTDDPSDYDRVDHITVTEYNSVQYIIAVSNDKLHIIEFD